MIVLLTCSRCGKVIGVKSGRVDLTCQSCGGYDFRLNVPIMASPIGSGNVVGRREDFGIDGSFTGNHKNGSSWVIEVMREWKTKEAESKVVVEKEEETIEEKPSLARTVRKLKLKVS